MDIKINTEISRSNSFTFSNISSLNGSQSLVDQQVSRLVKFVQCQRNNTIRRELETLLPPIICHLYMEMLKGREWRPAHEFLRKYACLVGSVQEMSQQKINGSDPNLLVPHSIHFHPHHQSATNLHQNIYSRFMPSTSSTGASAKHTTLHLSQLSSLDDQKLIMFRELISNLSYLKRLEDVNDNKLIFNFRSCKYKVKVSNKTLSILNKYLSKHGHVLLIQILHLWFNMDLYDLQDEMNDESSSSDCNTVLNSYDQQQLLDMAHNRNSSIDRFTDPSYCDTLGKDIKYNVNSGLHYDKSAARCDDNSMELLYGGSSCNSSSNIKMKRLRECLHRVDSKYHKPIRIFNINYTENRYAAYASLKFFYGSKFIYFQSVHSIDGQAIVSLGSWI